MRLTSTKSTIRPYIRPQTCTNGTRSVIFGSSELALVASTAQPQGSRSALASTAHAAPLKLSDKSPCSGTVTQTLAQTRPGEHLKPSAGLWPRRRQPRCLGPLDHCAPLTCPPRALLSCCSFKHSQSAAVRTHLIAKLVRTLRSAARVPVLAVSAVAERQSLKAPPRAGRQDEALARDLPLSLPEGPSRRLQGGCGSLPSARVSGGTRRARAQLGKGGVGGCAPAEARQARLRCEDRRRRPRRSRSRTSHGSAHMLQRESQRKQMQWAAPSLVLQARAQFVCVQYGLRITRIWKTGTVITV